MYVQKPSVHSSSLSRSFCERREYGDYLSDGLSGQNPTDKPDNEAKLGEKTVYHRPEQGVMPCGPRQSDLI